MGNSEFTIDIREKYLESGKINGIGQKYYKWFRGVTLTLEQLNSNLFVITKKEPFLDKDKDDSDDKDDKEKEDGPCLGILHIDDECSLIKNELENELENDPDEMEILGICRGVKWNNVNIHLDAKAFEIIDGKKCQYNKYNSEKRPVIVEYGYIEAQNIECVKEALTHVWMVEYEPLDI
jgi:hypothetical protein